MHDNKSLCSIEGGSGIGRRYEHPYLFWKRNIMLTMWRDAKITLLFYFGFQALGHISRTHQHISQPCCTLRPCSISASICPFRTCESLVGFFPLRSNILGAADFISLPACISVYSAKKYFFFFFFE